MPTPAVRWIEVEVPAARAGKLRSLAPPRRIAAAPPVEAPAEAPPAEAPLRFAYPDLGDYPTPLDKARFLLHTAAEIEHALLVQYLYAAYSLKQRGELTDPGQMHAVETWRAELVTIALEEMAHLMTVQHLLLVIRQPLNFEREDFPPRKGLYPFKLHLQPLTQESLSKYVVAESPVDATDIDDIVRQATGKAGMPINHVGVLYAVLGVVFSSPHQLEVGAAGGGDWNEVVREVAGIVGAGQAPADWYLPDEAFDPGSRDRQADPANWKDDDAEMLVFRVANRQECLHAIAEIGLQGEGMTTGETTSHFERFLRMYRGNAATLSFPPAGGWLPTRDVPIDPRVVRPPNPAGPQDISAPDAVRWAQLANARYAALLGMLEYYYHRDPADRDWIRLWCVSAMNHLRRFADRLTGLDRATGAVGKAAIPFELPRELRLPADPAGQRRLLRERLRASVTAADEVLAAQPNDPLATSIKQRDLAAIALLDAVPPGGGPGGGGNGESSSDAAMRALLAAKQQQASGQHLFVAVDGTNLRQLFRDKEYDRILAFLRTGTSVEPPFDGRSLVVPGDPQQSAFFLHISDPQGAMFGQFDATEIETVRAWIAALPSGGAPPPPSPTIAVAAPADRLTARRVAAGLREPLFVTAPPGDTARLFVVERHGGIRILDLASGQLKPGPFLQVGSIDSGRTERGLLGLAFHPRYSDNGEFFVNCTNTQGHTEVRRYRVSADPDRADPNSRQLVLSIEQPYDNHNGGWLAFGPRDGLLYVATGDGGLRNDPGNRAQNLRELLGKLLRIDVDRDDFPADPRRNYAVPPDNPFVGRADARGEIWAYGLRNPWRCSFDRRTGDLYLGDVGQNAREEIDFQPADSRGGENYGWRVFEGTRPTGQPQPAPGPFVSPLHEYDRDGDNLAAIGGYVYRGRRFPHWSGTYFFGDFGGSLWTLRRDAGGVRVADRTAELLTATKVRVAISSFGEDAAGELYLTALEGDVYRLEAILPGAKAASPGATAVSAVRATAASSGATAVSAVRDPASLPSGGAARQPLRIAATDWSAVAKIRIHPAIGVARLGNAGFEEGPPRLPADPADYFIGPERPFEVEPPAGGYKRAGRVRRQAPRFRLFAYDAADRLLGEVTAADAEISWTVELANRKAAFRRFVGPSPNASPRNAHVTGADRLKLEIVPGARSLVGPNQAAAFDAGTFTDWRQGQPREVSVYLGGAQTDADGRLLVLAGQGRSGSPWNKPIQEFANNDGWYDDAADGPIRAVVRFRGAGKPIVAVGGWVLCAPPKFAPALRNVVTLYDVLYQVAVDRGWIVPPAQPSFTQDIYPILERAMRIKWLMSAPGMRHDALAAAFPPANGEARKSVFQRLRHPVRGQGNNGQGMNMPKLFDDTNAWNPQGDAGFAVTRAMYDLLTKWRDGQFAADWTGQPPQPPPEVTPAGLDRAALENCSGGAFFPGIEAGWLLRDELDYLEPFRLDPAGLRAGDIIRQMAVPWQADFYDCGASPGGVGWWPQQRPDEVFPADGGERRSWTYQKVASHDDMVRRWHELGFVVRAGDRYVETDRNP